MPRITFPHMGYSYLAFQMLLEDLGWEVVIPPRPSKKTLDLGVQHAPEFACLPYKLLLGTYLETVAMGADTIVTTGGVGPCRAGHYAPLHREILHDLGYPVEMIILEPPLEDLWGFYKNVRALNRARLSYLGVYNAVKRAWVKLKYLDDLEKTVHLVRPREMKKGLASKAWEKGVYDLAPARTIKDIQDAGEAALERLRKIPQDMERQVVRIGIVGEIYVLLEPASNLEIEEILGNLGAEVHRSMFLTGWTKDNTMGETKHDLTVKEAAAPYLPELVGGHGRDSIGNTIIYAQQGYDGVIQLAPFTCIPEIVARTILSKVSQDHDIPVLTFFLDEQTGKAGVTTRLEAFIDLLKRKRQVKEAGQGQTKEVNHARVSGH